MKNEYAIYVVGENKILHVLNLEESKEDFIFIKDLSPKMVADILYRDEYDIIANLPEEKRTASFVYDVMFEGKKSAYDNAFNKKFNDIAFSSLEFYNNASITAEVLGKAGKVYNANTELILQIMAEREKFKSNYKNQVQNSPVQNQTNAFVAVDQKRRNTEIACATLKAIGIYVDITPEEFMEAQNIQDGLTR